MHDRRGRRALLIDPQLCFESEERTVELRVPQHSLHAWSTHPRDGSPSAWSRVAPHPSLERAQLKGGTGSEACAGGVWLSSCSTTDAPSCASHGGTTLMLTGPLTSGVPASRTSSASSVA
jgi:hypothetical protein